MNKPNLLDKYDIELLFATLDNLPVGGLINGYSASSLAVRQRIEQIKEKLGEMEEES